jgi:ATP-binding cassette subfamily B protein
LREFAAQLPHLPLALRLAWSGAPRYAAVWLALLHFQGLLPIATFYMTRLLVNAPPAAVRTAAPLSNSETHDF